MNADLRKIEQIEWFEQRTKALYDQGQVELWQKLLFGESRDASRPYLIDSDGVPPREGEFEK